MGLPSPREIPTGSETRVRIRCSEDTQEAFAKLCADMDPSLTQEEVLQKLYSAYYQNPERFR